MSTGFQLPSRERLAAIAAAAIEVFGRLGYRGTRTAEVAAKAGMSTGSLFTYVESKEALFHLVFLYCLRLLPDSPELPLRTPEPGATVALPARCAGRRRARRRRRGTARDRRGDIRHARASVAVALGRRALCAENRSWKRCGSAKTARTYTPTWPSTCGGGRPVGSCARCPTPTWRRTWSVRWRPGPPGTAATGTTASSSTTRPARRTTIEFVCAALIPETALQDTNQTQSSRTAGCAALHPTTRSGQPGVKTRRQGKDDAL
jgi:hypothetical protein